MDKSSNVRRKAIQLLGDFLKTHPFGVDGGELNLTFFKGRLTDIEKLLNEMAPTIMNNENQTEISDISMDMDGDSSKLQRMSTVDNSARIGSLLAQKQYYSDAIKFVTSINNIIPTICLLLSSTTKTEVFDVMEFLVDAHIYKLESSEAGIRKMLHLIWERELSSEDGTKQSIKEHLIENYRRIYLYADESIPPKDRYSAIARNLVGMVEGISIAELASLTELFSCFVKKNLIHELVINQIFALFASSEFDKRCRRSALILVSILSRTRREIVEKRLEILLKLGLGALGQSDPLIAQYTLISLQNLSTRIPAENVLFTRITNFILAVCNSSRWHPVINQAIRTIFLLSDRPAYIMAVLLTEQSREVFQNGHETSKAQLGKLLLMIGQVAACFSDHLEVIERHGKETAQKIDASSSNGANSDLAKVSASTEDDFTELVKGVREHEVLFGSNSILSILGPLVISVCSNNTIFNDVRIQRIATLSMAKLMTISSIFCERNLQLFLTILEKSPDSVIRSNLIIAFGDLAQGFNSLIDQNIDYLFNRLRDIDLTVRRNTLMVLTHLSLCGMIKVKGQIGEIAKCLIDPDTRIRNLARIFFSEMADRDSGTVGGSGIYNHIPDILSHLTGDESVSEESFKTIMKFIFEFIKKEKQMESLIEKLCGRFRNSDNLRYSRDLAFCLSLISFSGDRSLKKLVESFPLYQDKLVDEAVLGNFVEIVQRSKKFCKVEMKPLIEEFEVKLLKAANRDGPADGNLASFAALSQSIAKNQRTKTKNVKKSRKKYEASSDEEESDDYGHKPQIRKSSTRTALKSNVLKYMEIDDVEEENEQEGFADENKIRSNTNTKVTKKSTPQSRGGRKNKLVISDDEGYKDEYENDIF
jgi:condensin complex subunit 1